MIFDYYFLIYLYLITAFIPNYLIFEMASFGFHFDDSFIKFDFYFSIVKLYFSNYFNRNFALILTIHFIIFIYTRYSIKLDFSMINF